jgi:signal transduction histidine kinase
MIYGILDIAKIESGKLDIHLVQKDCVALCHECFSMLEPLADDKELEFEFIHDKYEFESFLVDEKIFKQVLLNLLSNAIKYTQKGKVTLELFSKKNALHVEVRDTGIGIQKSDLPKLFKEFSRIESGLSSKQKGTGLGLSLSKKLARAIGGDIYIQSEGSGVVASFVLKGKSV